VTNNKKLTKTTNDKEDKSQRRKTKVLEYNNKKMRSKKKHDQKDMTGQ